MGSRLGSNVGGTTPRESTHRCTGQHGCDAGACCSLLGCCRSWERVVPCCTRVVGWWRWWHTGSVFVIVIALSATTSCLGAAYPRVAIFVGGWRRRWCDTGWWSVQMLMWCGWRHSGHWRRIASHQIRWRWRGLTGYPILTTILRFAAGWWRRWWRKLGPVKRACEAIVRTTSLRCRVVVCVCVYVCVSNGRVLGCHPND